MQIYNWEDISNDFGDCLIIGNGSSISIEDNFSYESLYVHAGQAGLISDDIKRIFNYLRTNDFELVLQILFHTSHVNSALDITDDRTSAAYLSVRGALIQSVRDIHITYEKSKGSLFTISNFLKNFSTILSLNYDLIIYWTMLHAKQTHGNWFKDCFLNGSFQDDWRRFKEPYGADGSTLVFYPHGNLALATDIVGADRKIEAKHSSNLLDTIISEWESGIYTPLFVSEGNSDQKLKAIQRSNYLSTVYTDVITDDCDNVTIFGWSIGPQDHHILRALKKGNPQKFAISVYLPDGDIEEKCSQLEKVLKNNFGQKVEIFFFDAESDHCWAKP